MPRIYLSPPHMDGDERAFLLDAFDSNWIAPLGPHVDAFEKELSRKLGMSHAAALSSGTAALHLAMILLGVTSKDEIPVSTFTFVATANAVTYVGARPVFLDSEPGTWNMDPGRLEEELSACARRGRLPKAVVVVDLYGQCADYSAILGACDRYGIPVVEDAAEALGASYKGRPAGSFGKLGVLSFNGNKIITTAGGGMLVSDDAALIEKARYLATQSRDHAPHYEHSTVGYNYRMSNLLAAVGRGQLRHLEERVARKREIFDYYRRALGDLPGVDFMPEASYGLGNRWLTCLTVDPALFGATREDIRRALDALDIESRPVWKPMHLQPLFAGYRARGGSVSERIFARGLCLPSGTGLAETDLERIVAVVRSVFRGD